MCINADVGNTLGDRNQSGLGGSMKSEQAYDASSTDTVALEWCQEQNYFGEEKLVFLKPREHKLTISAYPLIALCCSGVYSVACRPDFCILI